MMSAYANSIRILAVDDHPVFREGLAVVIATQPDMRLVAEASTSGCEAMEQFRAHWPDITLMDLQMRGLSGLDAMVTIRNEFPQAKIILLTTFASDIEGARRLGARAYLLKADLDKELLGTIRAVHAGK